MYVSGASNVHKRRLLALSSQMRLMSFSSASAGHCVDPAGIADSQGQLLLLSSPSVLAERRGEVGFVLAGIWTWSFILGCVRSKQLFASIIICYNWLQIRRVQFLASCTRLVHFSGVAGEMSYGFAGVLCIYKFTCLRHYGSRC
jgi:hypothetical protein